jgi:microcystin-dependent protein
MATSATTNYSFPYPLGSDSLSNVALRIQQLAEYIDSTYTILGVDLSSTTPFLQVGDAAGGNLTGTYPNPTISTSVVLPDGVFAVTQAQYNNSTKLATTSYVDLAAYNVAVGTLPPDSIVNSMVNSAAAISYSKLNLTGSILVADLAFDPATQTELNTHTGASTSVHGITNTADLVYTVDARLSDTRTPTDGTVTNTKVAAGAAISYSKLNLTGSVLEADLAFSIATQAELDTHAGLTTSVHGITNTANLVYTSDSRLTDARTPTGAAGGVLSGTYPNPGFAVDMATQSELDTHASDTTSVHGIADTSVLATATDVSTAVSTHSSDTTSVHGIADTANLVLTGDARLSDARTPTSHAATHVPGGTDVLDYTKIVGYGTALPTWSATTHPAGVLWVVNTVGEPYSLYRSDGVSAWKQVGGGGASVTASDTAPSSPTSGALWFDSTTGKTFIWYVDGSSNQWVEVGEASQLSIPTHGSSHVRGGSDIIDGDRVTIDYVPSYYTRNAAASGAGDVTDLTAHLAGIDMILPAGMLMPYAGSTEPTGWVFCYGQTVNSVSNTAYARLWTAIGTTYGGASASSFILPDLRGRAVFGKDNMGGTAASRVTSGVSGITGTTLGNAGGNESMQSHYHNYYRTTTSGGSVTTGDIIWSVSGGNVVNQGGAGYLRTDTTGGNTGTGASQNMPPTIITNYLIKL